MLACLMKNIIGETADERTQLLPALDNPQGFYESTMFTALNEYLLELSGFGWDTPPLLKIDWSDYKYINYLFTKRSHFYSIAMKNTWLEKDPRLCITAPAMEHLFLRRVPIMAILRDPSEVAISLFRRNGMPYMYGLTIWFLYNYHLAASLRSNDLLLIYDQLITEKVTSHKSTKSLAKIESFLLNHELDISSKISIDLFESLPIIPQLNRSSSYSPSATEAAWQENPLCHHCTTIYHEIAKSTEMRISTFQQVFSAVPRTVLDVIAPLGFWQWKR